MSGIIIDYKAGSNGAYRVAPDPDDPVILQIDSRLCKILEISAQGFTCINPDLQQNRRYKFDLDLPNITRQIHGYMDVVSAVDDQMRYCEFADLGADDLDLLHRFVLQRQKQAIRSLRSVS